MQACLSYGLASQSSFPQVTSCQLLGGENSDGDEDTWDGAAKHVRVRAYLASPCAGRRVLYLGYKHLAPLEACARDRIKSSILDRGAVQIFADSAATNLREEVRQHSSGAQSEWRQLKAPRYSVHLY
eukprot:2147315-Amphidinium_carterae.3